LTIPFFDAKQFQQENFSKKCCAKKFKLL